MHTLFVFEGYTKNDVILYRFSVKPNQRLPYSEVQRMMISIRNVKSHHFLNYKIVFKNGFYVEIDSQSTLFRLSDIKMIDGILGKHVKTYMDRKYLDEEISGVNMKFKDLIREKQINLTTFEEANS